MESLTITSYGDLTNSFVMDMVSDDMFKITRAFELYKEKELFCEKIKDKYTRYMMLKPLIVIHGNNIYNKMFNA